MEIQAARPSLVHLSTSTLQRNVQNSAIHFHRQFKFTFHGALNIAKVFWT